MGTVKDDEAAARAVPPEPEHLSLAADFPAAERGRWVAMVDQVLRKARRIGEDAPVGAGVDTLTRTTPDGIRVPPLLTAADTPGVETGVPGTAPYVRGGSAAGVVPDGWDVRQRHAEPDVAAAREAIAADLENGVNSIWLVVGPAETDTDTDTDTGGTAVADLPAVLADVYLDLAPVVLDAGGSGAGAQEFLALAAERGVDPAALLGTLGLDPLGQRARTGDGPDVASIVPLARRVAEEFVQVKVVVVDALPVHGAGASDAQELGWSLAAGVAYLRALTGAGLDLATAARLLEFRYAATAEQFPTIAKLRAARRLWARVTEACGQALPQAQHAVTSPVMQTRRDPYVNLLRGTVAGFAAGVGGADAVTVAPFDAAIGASVPFSRRVARNTQTLLVEESHLARVIDPAGGSYVVEHLTEELARAAWAFFQQVEAQGGARAVLDSGWLAARVGEVRARRLRDVATRRAPLTGVSEFADLHEKPVERAPVAEPPGGGLPVFRLAEPYEAYRDRSDAIAERTGARPTAFLATLGPLAAYTARAGFARNLLAAGGVDTSEAGPTETVEDVVKAYVDHRSPVVVLCSTDALYVERAEATVAALREAGARRILLAGAADVPGLDGRLAAGCDALAVIESVYEALEGSQ
ncbi:methylmalonyl-CoA mutase family protein [Pseudonocardia sp.]|uniref:methylmalonyl-CoA mutase family protein n=1 Tax=Pseudonocardia sp. TaxID=60912 RepID=UPI003D0ADD20